MSPRVGMLQVPTHSPLVQTDGARECDRRPIAYHCQGSGRAGWALKDFVLGRRQQFQTKCRAQGQKLVQADGGGIEFHRRQAALTQSQMSGKLGRGP